MLLATSVGLIASLVYRYATEEKRGNLFHRAVSLFVGKQLATSLEESEAIALSGKRMEVTILFTDIRGFTAFTEQVCEEQGPEVVVQLLNEYMAHDGGDYSWCIRGHVNKFIGDGILAVFSDDDEGAAARRSCAARGSLRHAHGHGSEPVRDWRGNPHRACGSGECGFSR